MLAYTARTPSTRARFPDVMTSFANRSFWLDDYGPYEPNAPLRDDARVDVAVIGGGLLGLSSAWHLRQADAATDVAVIEAEVVGYGASGRAGGWVMTQFGLDQLSVKAKYGQARALEAYRYCERAVDYTRELIDAHAMQCDYRHPGVMRIAFDEAGVAALGHLRALYEDFGVAGEMTDLDEAALREEFDNPNFRAAVYEPNMGLMDPCKQVREWKRLACAAGVQVCENTPAVSIDREGSGLRIRTPRATLRAERVVLATNGYTHLLGGGVGRRARRDQSPLFARAMVTEPLTEAQWQAVGWGRRCAIESTFGLFHWFSPTADGRIVFFNAYYMDFPFGDEMNLDYDAVGAEVSERHFRQIFPALRDVKIAQTWGGPLSATIDKVPHLGFLGGDERVVIGTGCWGHGLGLHHLNGRTVADLLTGTQSDLTDFWIVNRKTARWPVRPLDYLGKRVFVEYYRWLDRRTARDSMFVYD